MATVTELQLQPSPSVPSELPKSWDVGDGTTIEWVPVKDLLVDTRYQRPLAVARARAIAHEFNPAALGLLFVNRRTDKQHTMAVYDGQTRLEALRLRGETAALCHVVHGLTAQQEAQAFVDCNKIRGAVATIYLYRAELAFGDPAAVAVQELLDRRGIVISDSVPDVAQAPIIRAVGSLQIIVRKYGLSTLETVLDIIGEAWPGYSQDAYMGDTMKALARVLTLRGNTINAERLTVLLRGTTADALIARGRMLSVGTKWHRLASMSNAIIELWNRGTPRSPDVPYIGRSF